MSAFSSVKHTIQQDWWALFLKSQLIPRQRWQKYQKEQLYTSARCSITTFDSSTCMGSPEAEHLELVSTMSWRQVFKAPLSWWKHPLLSQEEEQANSTLFLSRRRHEPKENITNRNQSCTTCCKGWVLQQSDLRVAVCPLPSLPPPPQAGMCKFFFIINTTAAWPMRL